jgi:hypothetical protein
MHVIRARNVHDMLPLGLSYLASAGIPSPSRNGGVVVAPLPVTSVYNNPTERVLFWPERDANPFFHFFEALWMLAGRNDLEYLTNFIKSFENFSDNGKTLNAAYGYRWRVHFGLQDQITANINLLARDPWSRQAVIAMWDPMTDGPHLDTRDRACNTHIYLSVGYGKANEPNRLNMTVLCRSNDIIWGAYGANAVHFSFLQEYIAAKLGLAVGTLYQVSNNYHAYLGVYEKTRQGNLQHPADPAANPYAAGEVLPFPLVTYPEHGSLPWAWDLELAAFMANPAGKFNEPFFEYVAKPLWWAHVSYKRKAFDNALEIASDCAAFDWRRATQEWLERRRKAWQAKRRQERELATE